MNFHSSGWFKQYLQFRLKNPFDFINEKIEMREAILIDRQNENYEKMNELFYRSLRESGVLFGCPILNPELLTSFKELKFLSSQDQATYVNIENLFSSMMREIVMLVPNLGSYGEYLTRTTLRVIQFYLGLDLDTRFFAMEFDALIKDKEFSRLLSFFEKKFLVRIKGRSRFNLVNSIQNNPVFLDIYSLINWNRKFHNQSTAPIYFLSEVEQNHIAIQKQLILIFAGLLWQDQPSSKLMGQAGESLGGEEKLSIEQKIKMLKRYVRAARLPKQEKQNLIEIIKHPIDLNNIPYEVSEYLINKYILEQTILLSMIDEGTDPTRVPFIMDLSDQMKMKDLDLATSIGSVAEFFFINESRFDFIRGNRAISNMTGQINRQINNIIRKNLDRIMNEIQQTGRLYSLLMKSGNERLTAEEKKYVREQLLSIAKLIPALGIFCMPAGGLVLAVLIKVLPFNILPNSFAD